MAAYSGNWNGAPSSTGGSREGGNSASPYMRNGMFKGSFEGPNTSIAVRTGKYDGVPSGFRSASPYMQGGQFRGGYEGAFSRGAAAEGRGNYRGGGGFGGGGGGGGYGGPTGPVAGIRPPVMQQPLPPMAQPPQPVSGLMGRPVFGPPPVALNKSMLPGLFGGLTDSLTPYAGSVPSIGPFNGTIDQMGRIVGSPAGYSQQRTGAYAGSMYGNPNYGTPGYASGLGNYGGGSTYGLKGNLR